MNDRIIKMAFLISIVAHLLLLNIPVFNPATLKTRGEREFIVEIGEESLPLTKRVEPKPLSKPKPIRSSLPEPEPVIEPRIDTEYRNEIIEREPEPEPRLISEREWIIETDSQSIPQKENVREDLLVLIRRRIEAVKDYPKLAQDMGFEGVVRIEFIIMKEGRVDGLRIVGSSGFKTLDKAALATIRRASPFSDLPEDMGERLKIRVPIVYRLVEDGM